MWITLQHGSLRLAADTPASFRRARGTVLECTEGRLWITITGQAGDFLLAAGERLTVSSDGLGLVEGFPAGVLRVVPACGRRPAEERPAPGGLVAVRG